MKLALSLLVILLMAEVCSSQCRVANWWSAFDKKGWVKCDHSTEYLTGLYRNDNWGNNDGVFLIEEGSCCKALGLNQNQPSTCVNANWWRVLDRLEEYLSSGIYVTPCLKIAPLALVRSHVPIIVQQGGGWGGGIYNLTLCIN